MVHLQEKNTIQKDLFIIQYMWTNIHIGKQPQHLIEKWINQKMDLRLYKGLIFHGLILFKTPRTP